MTMFGNGLMPGSDQLNRHHFGANGHHEADGFERSSTDVVSSFRGLRALVIGDVMLDTYLEGTASRICKEGPVPVVDLTDEEHAPGGAANVAANLHALGADVILIGLVGRDEAASQLRRALHQRGIDDAHLVEDADCSTMRKTRIVANGQMLIRFDRGETRNCGPKGLHLLLHHLEHALGQCDLVVVSDYGYGAVPDAAIGLMRDWRVRRKRVMTVDAKDVLRYAEAGVSCLTPSLAEAWNVIEKNKDLPMQADPTFAERIGSRLHQRVDAELLSITLAGDGVMLSERSGRTVHLPAHEVERAGDIGAGDSFTAAVALALASGATSEQAVRIGIDAAGIAVTQHRTAIVEHQDLLRRVSLEGRAPMFSPRAVAIILDADRFKGKRIVFTNGVFDILHAGHVDLLQRAKSLGDILVVGLNSDASTRRLKGPTRPIVSERDRLALVAALEPVDFAVLFDEDTPEELIRVFRPHIHVKGGDYRPDELKEAEAVREVGARIEILSLVVGRSTTNVINKIGSLFANGQVEAIT
jgi:D-beta-D-heptose 7-phosphate kinase / D-beta-D-heptose 1-phosphate adenosyltransferase